MEDGTENRKILKQFNNGAKSDSKHGESVGNLCVDVECQHLSDVIYRELKWHSQNISCD